MDTDEILRRVFGASPIIEHATGARPKENDLTTTRYKYSLVRNLRLFLFL